MGFRIFPPSGRIMGHTHRLVDIVADVAYGPAG